METFFHFLKIIVDKTGTQCYNQNVPEMETERRLNMTNSEKLTNKIKGTGYTLSSFSEALGISRVALRNKIDGRTEFKASEIKNICSLLSIPAPEVSEYFFA